MKCEVDTDWNIYIKVYHCNLNSLISGSTDHCYSNGVEFFAQKWFEVINHMFWFNHDLWIHCVFFFTFYQHVLPSSTSGLYFSPYFPHLYLKKWLSEFCLSKSTVWLTTLTHKSTPKQSLTSGKKLSGSQQNWTIITTLRHTNAQSVDLNYKNVYSVFVTAMKSLKARSKTSVNDITGKKSLWDICAFLRRSVWKWMYASV